MASVETWIPSDGRSPVRPLGAMISSWDSGAKGFSASSGRPAPPGPARPCVAGAGPDLEPSAASLPRQGRLLRIGAPFSSLPRASEGARRSVGVRSRRYRAARLRLAQGLAVGLGPARSRLSECRAGPAAVPGFGDGDGGRRRRRRRRRASSSFGESKVWGLRVPARAGGAPRRRQLRV